MKREHKKNIENLEKVMEQKKIIPKEVKDKINAKRFENLIAAIIVLIYLAGLNMGKANIPTDTYIMDLKVFSIMLLIVTIITFEYAYKKDKGGAWLHGIEIMMMAIFTLYLIYLYSIYYSTYDTVLMSVGMLYLIYYIIKILITNMRMKKKYNKSLTDIGEIVKK